MHSGVLGVYTNLQPIDPVSLFEDAVLLRKLLMPVRYLTKSRFKMAIECPAKLNYTGRPEFINTDESNEMLLGLAEGGYQVGALAQAFYAREAEREGVAWEEIHGNQEEQIALTESFLSIVNITLFEPTFVYENYLVRVDVLRKRGRVIDLIEVKSKSVDTERNKSDPLGQAHYRAYLLDVAFQTMVVREAFPEWQVRSYLMMPDRSKSTSSLGLHRLFPVRVLEKESSCKPYVEMPLLKDIESLDLDFMSLIPVDGYISSVIDGVLTTQSPGVFGTFKELVKKWGLNYARGDHIEASIGSQNCGTCEFYVVDPEGIQQSGFHRCWQQKVPEFYLETTREQTVLGLFKDQRRLKRRLIEEGRHFLNQIRKEDLGWTPISGPLTVPQRQWMQVSRSWPGAGHCYFDHNGFEVECKSWKYPFYFLDFETARTPLPLRQNQRPNAINVFQYSLHVMQESGEFRHLDQFLCVEPGADLHSRFLRQLRQAITGGGTVFHWARYEKDVLGEITREICSERKGESDKHELLEFIASLTGDSAELTMVDQSLIAEKYFFHPDTQGSSSIKKVFPTIMNSSNYLRRTYSVPCYGGADGIPSKNLRDFPVTWWRSESANPNRAINPYFLLSEIEKENKPDQEMGFFVLAEKSDSDDLPVLKDGGGAMMAYLRQQSGALSHQQSQKLQSAMLRYCELDTLAMVMIMQAWLHGFDQ